MIYFFKRIFKELNEFFFKKSKIKTPDSVADFIKTYIDKINNTQIRNDQLIDDIRFVIFDTETTGIALKKDKLLSIGALAIENNTISVAGSFELFIQQNDIIGDEAIGVHGILKKGKKIKISEREAVEYFINFCGDSVLVGHHVNFDIAMINLHLEKNYGIKLYNRTIDTGALEERVAFFETNYYTEIPLDLSLDALAKKHNIDTADRHRALGDAYITGILFMKLINQLKKKNVLTLKDLMRTKFF
jgi:DNA polymerase III subunit epsilon